jgi:ATP-binding cassette subfamily B multidrug efflux pump
MKTVFSFFKRELKWYIPIMLMLTLVDFSQVTIPVFTKKAVDAITKKNTALIIKYGVYIIIIALCIIAIRYTYNYILRKLVLKLDFELKTALFNRYLEMHKGYFEKQEIGDLMARVTNDTRAVRMFLIMGFLGGMDIVLLGITTFIMMFIMSPMLSIYVAIPLILLIPLALNFGHKIHKYFKNVQTIFGEMTVRVREAISGIRVIKAFTRENFYLKLFDNVNERYLRENMKLVKLDGFLDPTIDFLINVSIIILILKGGILVIQNRISLGTLVAFSQYIGTLAWPMMAIGFTISLMQRARASLGRINVVLQAKPEIRDTEKTKLDIKFLKGNIKINNLHFKYPESEREILNGISLSVHPGELIGITGPTGSGKTTLLELILRVYNPAENSIAIDGFDVLEIPLKVLRSSIGYTPQEPFLFTDTLLTNIKLGREEATMEEVIEAAQIAAIHKTIESLPEKYNTIVGEKGITLSGGERQRVAIARAVITKRPIMLFDDPLSAVDTDTENIIISRLRDYLRKNRITAIITSQRISALTVMDRVAVLSAGKIIEEGKPDELFNQGGYYYHLYRKQILEGMEA